MLMFLQKNMSMTKNMSFFHKTRGSYKDDRTSDRVNVFSVEGRRKKRIKVSNIFLKDMSRNTVELLPA